MNVKSKTILITILCFIVMNVCYFAIKDKLNIHFNFKSKSDDVSIVTKSLDKAYDYSVPVPASKRAQNNYFDDAVFFGDSITYGLIGNFPINSNYVIACKGASIKSMMGKVELSGKEEKGAVNAIGEIVELNSKKIYIMLGINGLAWMTTQQVIDDYEELIDLIMLANPDAKIYIQSIFPVSDYKYKLDSRYSNIKIDKINNGLLELACKKEVYFP